MSVFAPKFKGFQPEGEAQTCSPVLPQFSFFRARPSPACSTRADGPSNIRGGDKKSGQRRMRGWWWWWRGMGGDPWWLPFEPSPFSYVYTSISCPGLTLDGVQVTFTSVIIMIISPASSSSSSCRWKRSRTHKYGDWETFTGLVFKTDPNIIVWLPTVGEQDHEDHSLCLPGGQSWLFSLHFNFEFYLTRHMGNRSCWSQANVWKNSFWCGSHLFPMEFFASFEGTTTLEQYLFLLILYDIDTILFFYLIP